VRLPGRSAAPAAATTPEASGATAVAENGPSAELLAQRDRLTERFALMQSELGGLFYEMAIRDHVRLDVLVEKAAALQRVDIELGQVRYLLNEGDKSVGGHCPNCGHAHARGAAFCSQCAAPLGASER
jgi:hypothetical protein